MILYYPPRDVPEAFPRRETFETARMSSRLCAAAFLTSSRCECLQILLTITNTIYISITITITIIIIMTLTLTHHRIITNTIISITITIVIITRRKCAQWDVADVAHRQGPDIYI